MQRDDTFVEVWADQHDRLVARATRMLGDSAAAEDVVQEAFRRLSGTPLNEIDDVGGWLAVVLPRTAFLTKGSTAFRRWLFGQTTVERLDFLLNRARWAFDAEERGAEETRPAALSAPQHGRSWMAAAGRNAWCPGPVGALGEG